MPVITAPLPRLLEIALAACAVAPGAVGLPRFAAWRSAQHTLLSPHYRSSPLWEIDLGRDLCDALGLEGFVMPAGDDPLCLLCGQLAEAFEASAAANAATDSGAGDAAEATAAHRRARTALDALLIGCRLLASGDPAASLVEMMSRPVPPEVLAGVQAAEALRDALTAFEQLTDGPGYLALDAAERARAERTRDGLRHIVESCPVKAVPSPAPFAMPAPAAAATLWAVHVRGPDDVVPVASYEEAVRLCDYSNAFWLTIPMTEDDPWVSAVPMVWDGTAQRHAELIGQHGGAGYPVPDAGSVQAVRARAAEARARDTRAHAALSALQAAERRPTLPCEVVVAPGSIFRRGVHLTSVLAAIERRAGRPDAETTFGGGCMRYADEPEPAADPQGAADVAAAGVSPVSAVLRSMDLRERYERAEAVPGLVAQCVADMAGGGSPSPEASIDGHDADGRDPFAEGREAHDAGQADSDCPYTLGGAAAIKWHDGYNAAQDGTFDGGEGR